jgi:uncharacterized membrane protein YidH (DUF202 family)
MILSGGVAPPRGDSDVTRRTQLADERTYLAYLRTGLSAFAVSLGAGKVVPALTHGEKWPYQLLGVGFALVGMAIVGFGLIRHRAIERALSSGQDVTVNPKMVASLAAGILPLGVVLLGIVLFA